MKRTIGSRSIGRGLAKVEPSSPNTIIAFSAKAGSTASDGDSKNSPFSKALVDYLPEPGLDLRKAFGFVRDDVLKATNNKQEPFIYGSLGGNDVPLVPAAPAPPVVAPVDRDGAMRRDYELADRVGTKPVWDSFINKYPSGFYTALAKAQRDKLDAEDARIESTIKAKAAQEEQARLAIEGAKAAEQARAADEARAAEQARVAAELAKKAEEAKVQVAERENSAAMAKAAEEAKAVEAERLQTTAASANTREDATLAADKKAADTVAALTSHVDKLDQPTPSDIARLLRAELRRVGCNSESIDGPWNAASRRSLDLFNKNTGMRLDAEVASLDALDAVRSKTARICPLICGHGYKADGERCVKITCGIGTFLNNDGECEKKLRPIAKREEPRAKFGRSQREKITVQPAKPQTSLDEIVCTNQGCHPVQKGCRIVLGDGGSGPR